jgi:hypothetical protein
LMCGNSDSVSNDIDEIELEFEKQDAEKIWTWRGIIMFDLLPRDRINCVFDESRMKSDQIVKCESFDSTEITVLETNEKQNHLQIQVRGKVKKSKAGSQKPEIRKIIFLSSSYICR